MVLGQFDMQLENKAGSLTQKHHQINYRHIKNLHLKGKTLQV